MRDQGAVAESAGAARAGGRTRPVLTDLLRVGSVPRSVPVSGPSPSFDLLNPLVRRWVIEHGWPNLFNVQEFAIPPILARKRDVLIGSRVAAGRTEGVFLPICSELAVTRQSGTAESVRTLFLGPLTVEKDRVFDRVEQLCRKLGIGTARWAGGNHPLGGTPGGILRSTPESLIDLVAATRAPARLAELFGGLRYVVVDEVHTLGEDARTARLIATLDRLETVLGDRVPRIGLSADPTGLSDAAERLRPGRADEAVLLRSVREPTLAH